MKSNTFIIFSIWCNFFDPTAKGFLHPAFTKLLRRGEFYGKVQIDLQKIRI